MYYNHQFIIKRMIMHQNKFKTSLVICIVLTAFIPMVCSVSVLSRPIKTIYNQYGEPYSFIIQFKPLSKIYSNQLIQLVFPDLVHFANPYLLFSLSKTNDLPLIPFQRTLTPTLTFGSLKVIYHLPLTHLSSTFTKYLNQQEWYEITLLIQSTPAMTLGTGIVQFRIISTDLPNQIRSISDGALEYFFINATLAYLSPHNINIAITNPSQILTSPTALYPVQIMITPTVGSTTQTTLKIQFTNTTYDGFSFTPRSIQQNHFVFQGVCQILCQNALNCLNPDFCQVKSQQITIQVPYLTAAQPFTVKVWVRNPDFVSIVNIQAFWVQQNNFIGGIGILNSALSVQSIQLIAGEIRLFWGIPYATAQSMKLGIFLGETMNNVDIGFSINAGTPIGTIFKVLLYLGADGVLESSINTNLPQKNIATKVSCTYENPYIVCKNVGAFTRVNYRYFIRAKAQFMTALTASFGGITIQHERDPSLTLIDPLIGAPIDTIVNSDYRDYTGIHSGNYWLEDTMVIGRKDTHLPNSSYIKMKNLFTLSSSDQSFIGIDPSIRQQQLLFLLKVGPTLMASAAQPTNQTYTMKVYYNPNAIAKTSSKGLDFAAFNSTNQNWQLESASCYVNTYPNPTNQSYACQKYDDHVVNSQVDNIWTINQFYGQYSWTCGQGTATVCTDGDCESQCNIFKGFSSTGLAGHTQGSGGFFSMRNVTFQPGYHSPILANQKNLDFVIVFYHGTTLVSASLINAYTMSSKRLEYLNINFVNKYNDGFTINDGSRIPTMLHLYGKFSLSQFPSQGISQLQFFLPQTVDFNDFVQQNTNYQKTIGCSQTCYIYSSLGCSFTSFDETDSWLLQKSISVKPLPMLTQNFRILIPLKLLGAVQSVTMITKNANSVINGVYRFNGSSIQQTFIPLSLPKYNLTQLKIPNILWTLGTTPYVNDGVFSYLQGLDMTKITNFSPFNVISMNSSVLQDDYEGSCTFSTAYQSIFSASSVVRIDGMQQNCVRPFRYRFNAATPKNIFVIWCQTQKSGVNQINITYPVYPNNYGTGFAYSQALAYAFSNKNGELAAYRHESLDRSATSLCITQKVTEYSLNALGSQQTIIEISFAPLKFSHNSINRIQIYLAIPVNVPVIPTICSAKQKLTRDLSFSCTYDGIIVANTHSFTLLYSTTLTEYQITILKIELKIRTISGGTPSVAATSPSYKASIYIPQTEAGNKVYFGRFFNPYKSLVYQCQNTFTYSDIPAASEIIRVLNDTYPVNPDEFNNPWISDSLVDLKMEFKFATTRSTILQGSSITFNFTSDIFDQYFSQCQISPFWNLWKIFDIESSLTSIQFQPKQSIQGFTDTIYTLTCRKIKPKCPLSVNIHWMDGVSVQRTSTSYVFSSCPASLISSSSSSATIIDKFFATQGYFGAYKIQYSLSTDGINSVSMHMTLLQRNIIISLLECWYITSSNVYKPIMCTKDINQKILIYFVPEAGSTFVILIKGIHQQLIKDVNYLNIHTTIEYRNQYFTYLLSDVNPGTIAKTQLPIIITDIQITANSQVASQLLNSFNLEVSFVFPVDYMDMILFLQIDQLLVMQDNYHSISLCQVDGLPFTCTRVSKNVVKIQINFILYLNTTHIIQVGPFLRTQLPTNEIDGQFLHFKMFVADVSQNNVLRGSSTYLDQDIPISTIYEATNYANLYWNLTAGQVFRAYVGYYGPSLALLSNFTDLSGGNLTITQFIQQIELSPLFTSVSNVYLMKDLIAHLGQQSLQLNIAADPNLLSAVSSLSSVGLQYVPFSHSSLSYYQLSSLPIMIVNQKCKVTAEYTVYSIYPEGVTIPIKLDFTLCRPITNLTLTYTVNSAFINADNSLSNSIVDFQNPVAYIVLRHGIITGLSSTIGNNYVLTVSIAGNQAVYYETIPTINIEVKDPANIVGNPQAKQPIINSLTYTQLDIQLQCNQPSTIYYAVGIFPSVIGVVSQQIQSKLLQNQRGLNRFFSQQFQWTYDEYGFTYVIDSNIETNLTITGLFGNENYVFKYFCVNQLGKSSGGKILYFNTPDSNHSLIKILLDYQVAKNSIFGIINPPTQISYQQNNHIACAIAQLLVIPYRQAISSTFSNCKNNPQIIYQNDTIFNDEAVKNSFNRYLFYVNTQKKTVQEIQNKLINYLKFQSIFVSKAVPPFSSIKVQKLRISTSKQPSLVETWNSSTSSTIKIVVNVGIQNSYAIAALMNLVYDPLTMSIPQHYLIKQGIFSNNTKFEQVLMKYGRKNITLQFTNLIPNNNYSIFYFSTVDNSALNSHPSVVKHLQLMTTSILKIDLYSEKMAFITVNLLMILLICV